MKKIVAIFDGLKYAESTATYAMEFAGSTGSLLVGVFADNHGYRSYGFWQLLTGAGGLVGSGKRKLDHKDAKRRASHVSAFETSCQAKGIEYAVHRDHDRARPAIVAESVYSDLLVIAKSENFRRNGGTAPTAFVRKIIGAAHCPILVVAPVYHRINCAVLMFDGSDSGVEAMRSFANVLGTLPLDTIEILLTQRTGERELRNYSLLTEWLAIRFRHKFRQIHLPSTSVDTIAGYFKNRDEGALLVLRNDSVKRRFFGIKPSLSEVLLTQLNNPILIA